MMVAMVMAGSMTIWFSTMNNVNVITKERTHDHKHDKTYSQSQRLQRG